MSLGVTPAVTSQRLPELNSARLGAFSMLALGSTYSSSAPTYQQAPRLTPKSYPLEVSGCHKTLEVMSG